MKKLEIISDVSNGGVAAIESGVPYTMIIKVEGTADLLFHRWNCDAVEAKAKAAKNSTAKKTDDLESFVYRADNGHMSVPGEYFRQSTIHSAKYRQDPRSPRKSAMDLFKAGLLCLTNLCDLGTKDWDYLDRRRVLVQRNGITRIRPAMRAGWNAEFEFLVNTPEYIDAHLLVDVVSQAGRLVGVGDFRPTFGRFSIKRWEVR